MKIFWSWQSDTPGNIGRHFIKETLEMAIRELKKEIEVDEPNRGLHLDHDRKGIPGSPDLASTILEKIKLSSVFIADVTPIGQTTGSKPLINSNVAIELGYALAYIGDRGLLMVLNESYGDRDALPFDLRHKAGPIIFSLKPGATKDERLKAQKSLAGDFKEAIRVCLEALPEKVKSEKPKHIEIESTVNSAVYFRNQELLAKRENEDHRTEVSFGVMSPLLYLRVIPEFAVPEMKRSEIRSIIYGIGINPLRGGIGRGASWEPNRFGGITFSEVENSNGEKIFTTSQVFTNREIWGIDATILQNGYIPSETLEKLYYRSTYHYLEVAVNKMGLKPPLIIEAGATNINNFNIAMPHNQRWGPIYDNEIILRQTLDNIETNKINRLILEIFNKFYDAAGRERPKNLYGFPMSNKPKDKNLP